MLQSVFGVCLLLARTTEIMSMAFTVMWSHHLQPLPHLCPIFSNCSHHCTYIPMPNMVTVVTAATLLIHHPNSSFSIICVVTLLFSYKKIFVSIRVTPTGKSAVHIFVHIFLQVLCCFSILNWNSNSCFTGEHVFVIETGTQLDGFAHYTYSCLVNYAVQSYLAKFF